MEAGNNNSSSTTEHEFSCCCGISWEEFQASATTPVVTFSGIVLVLTSISAVVGNSLVLASIWRTPSLHSPSNVLIVGLAVSDLCVGLLVEPAAFVYQLAQSNVMSALVFCYAAVLVWSSGNLLTLASLITITAISLDFYLALHLHLRYKELVTVARMVRVVVAMCDVWRWPLSESGATALHTSIQCTKFPLLWFISTPPWIPSFIAGVFITFARQLLRQQEKYSAWTNIQTRISKENDVHFDYNNIWNHSL